MGKSKSILIFYTQYLGADLTNVQLINEFNKGICFSLFRFSKYACVIPLKEKSTAITNTFRKILDDSNCKPNKTWVDKDNITNITKDQLNHWNSFSA